MMWIVEAVCTLNSILHIFDILNYISFNDFFNIFTNVFLITAHFCLI